MTGRTDGWQPHGTPTLGMMQYDLELSRRANAQLRAELDKCREALRMVEWLQHPYEVSYYCPWCKGLEDFGHSKDCSRQRALEAQNGK